MRERPGFPGGAVAAAVVLAAAVLATSLPVRGPRALVVDLGPNDRPYLDGFARDYEIGPEGWGRRWSLPDATVRWPFEVSGPLALTYRLARVLPESAEVDVSLGGRTIDRFKCRGGAVLERRAETATAGPTPLEIRFLTDSHDRQHLGLQFDWVRAETGPGARLRLRPSARLWPVLAILGLAALVHLAGASRRHAAILGVALSAALAAGLWRSPLETAHVAAHLAGPSLLAVALVSALCLRGHLHGGWVATVVVAGFLLKGAWLFHPAAYYPDVQHHRRYLVTLRETPGSLWERMRTAQLRLHWGERRIAGETYAMPYSPVFYLPFFALPDDDQLVEDSMRHTALAAAGLEPLAAYAIGALALSPGAGLAAAALSAALAPQHSRLLLAMWPTVVGHLLDLLAILAALRWVQQPTRRRLAALAAAVLAAMLAYITSLFSMCGFLLALALLERRRARPLVALSLGGATLVVALLYGPTLLRLAGVLGAAVQAAAQADLGGTAPTTGPYGPLPALARLPLFFGWPTLAFAAGGAAVAWRRTGREARHGLLAWALAFAGMLALRAFGGGAFRDLKEITFVSTLLALLAGAAVDEIGRRFGRTAAVLTLCGLVALGLARSAGFRAGYTSIVTAGAWRAAP